MVCASARRFAAGIPLFAYIVLRRIKNDLEEWRKTFGFLYSSYQPRVWYWEVVQVSKKVLFAFAGVYLRPTGVATQANTGILVVVVALALQLQIKPFVSNELNNLEAASLLTQFLTLSIGMYFFSEGTTEGARMVLTIVILLVNVLFLFLAARKVYASSAGELTELASKAKTKLEGYLGRPIALPFISALSPRQGSSASALAGSVASQQLAHMENPMRAAAPRIEMASVRGESVPSPAEKPAVAESDSALLQGWSREHNTAGRLYYANRTTGQTSWSAPTPE